MSLRIERWSKMRIKSRNNWKRIAPFRREVFKSEDRFVSKYEGKECWLREGVRQVDRAKLRRLTAQRWRSSKAKKKKKNELYLSSAHSRLLESKFYGASFKYPFFLHPHFNPYRYSFSIQYKDGKKWYKSEHWRE